MWILLDVNIFNGFFHFFSILLLLLLLLMQFVTLTAFEKWQDNLTV